MKAKIGTLHDISLIYEHIGNIDPLLVEFITQHVLECAVFGNLQIKG